MCSALTTDCTDSNDTARVSSVDPTTTTTNRKQVRFEEERLEEMFELEIISEQERKAKWMTRADFRAIHSEISQALNDCYHPSQHYKPPQDGDNDDDEDERCFRGLEALISTCRRVQIQSFIQDLLEIQEDYKQLGLLGPAGLQNYSENNSRDAKEKARRMAEVDASEARRVYAELFASQQQERQ